MELRLAEHLAQLKRLETQLNRKVKELSVLRKAAFAPEGSAADKAQAKQCQQDAQELHARFSQLLEEGLRLAGLSEKDIESLEAREPTGEFRLLREEITSETIEPSGLLEEILPGVLEHLYSKVDPVWLREQAANRYGLGEEYLQSTLSIVSGTRVVDEINPIHQYAQALLVAKDFVEGQPGYDFHSGALLVSQMARLGSLMPALREVTGNVGERVRSLWEGTSENVDPTIFELLVAGSCVERGRVVEALIPTQEHTPDFRIHDFPMPCVVECKRRRWLFDYERAEELTVRNFFKALADGCGRFGIRGIIEVSFTKELQAITQDDFTATVMRVARFALQDTNVNVDKGGTKISRIARSARYRTNAVVWRVIFGKGL